MGNKNSTSNQQQQLQQQMHDPQMEHLQLKYLRQNYIQREASTVYIGKPQKYIPGPVEPQRKRKIDTVEKYDDDEPISVIDSNDSTTKQASAKINPDEFFNLSLKLKYDTFQINSASNTVEPLLFTLKTLSTQQQGSRAPIDLICVLDVSGSMLGSKLWLLQDTLTYLVELLGDDDRISIIEFSDSANRVTPLQRVTEINKPTIIAAIKGLFAEGGTMITEGMNRAVRVIKERKYKNAVTSVFLLSDGQDELKTEAIERIKKLFEANQSIDNFTVHSFGYGRDHDPNLMSSIAKLKDGNFYFVQEVDTVEECFVDAIGGLISVVGQDVTITIQPVKSEVFPNLEIKKAFGGSDLWKEMNGTYSTGISQLPSGKSKNYILELLIPKCTKTLTDQQKEVVIAKALVTIKIPNSSEVWKKECELKIKLVNEDEELPQQQIADKDLFSNYYRVRSAEIMMEAKKLAEKADYEGGRKILQNFKEELSKSAVKDEPMVKGLLDDIETTIKEMQPKVYEEVGQHRLAQQVISHMEEKSNPCSANSANLYSNCVQQEMVTKVRSKKSQF